MSDLTYLLLAIAAISVAAFIPRVIPFLLPKGRIKSRFLNSFLNYIPYSVLGAMIFPAIFFATSSLLASIAMSSHRRSTQGSNDALLEQITTEQEVVLPNTIAPVATDAVQQATETDATEVNE